MEGLLLVVKCLHMIAPVQTKLLCDPTRYGRFLSSGHSSHLLQWLEILSPSMCIQRVIQQGRFGYSCRNQSMELLKVKEGSSYVGKGVAHCSFPNSYAARNAKASKYFYKIKVFMISVQGTVIMVWGICFICGYLHL